MTVPSSDTLQQRTAPTCLAIRIVTGIMLAITAGLLIASLFSRWFLPVAALMSGIVVICYRTSPVSFELDRTGLTVVTRAGRRSFGPAVRCSRLERKPGLTIRLWSNGGLFAGTGIYWNRAWGVFRAYVTAGSYGDYVLVETQDKKVLISPEDPAAFVEACVRPPRI